MNDRKGLIDFPCHFPIKIIGKNSANFLKEVNEIIFKHFPETPEKAIRNQESQQGTYLAITVTIYALDQLTLDAFYKELTKHPDMKMVL